MSTHNMFLWGNKKISKYFGRRKHLVWNLTVAAIYHLAIRVKNSADSILVKQEKYLVFRLKKASWLELNSASHLSLSMLGKYFTDDKLI